MLTFATLKKKKRSWYDMIQEKNAYTKTIKVMILTKEVFEQCSSYHMHNAEREREGTPTKKLSRMWHELKMCNGKREREGAPTKKHS